MKTQFNFSKITLTVVLFFSFIFSTNLMAQLTVSTDISDYNGSNISCLGEADGWIRVTPNNAIGNVTFHWSNGDSIDQISDLTAGYYEVIVSDSISSVVVGIELLDPAPILLTTQAPQTPFGYNLICNGDNKGRILASATGGTGKLTYEWSNGSFLVNQSNLAAGTYTVTVTDENNCKVSNTEVLTEPDPVTVTVTLISETTNNLTFDGQALAIAQGGQGGFSFLWDNNEANDLATQLGVGLHTMKAIDHYGCAARGTVDVTSANGMTPSAPTTIIVPHDTIGGSRRSNTIFKPTILNNDIKNEGVMIQNVENFQENSLLISDMMGNVRVQLQNVKSVNNLNVNLERGHYVAVLVYRNENGEMESVTNQISIR